MLIPRSSLPLPANATFIIDFRVLLFINISNHKAGLEKLTWASIFHSLPGKLVVVDDCKPYWRTNYLKQHYPHLPGYKDGRSEKTEAYWAMYKSGIEFIKQNNIDYFAQVGYEADDWAGAICRNRHPVPIILYTTDKDWFQLVSDEQNIMVYCPGKWKQHSQLIDEAEVIYSYGMSPSQIVNDKIINGDAGDNLFPTSPREVIDLTISPPQDFTETQTETLLSAIANPAFTPNKQIALLAELKLNSETFK